MQSAFSLLRTQWNDLPSGERLQVSFVAVITGWLIQFFVGGVAFYFARNWQFLSFFHDVMEGSPVTPITSTTAWLFVVMAWLFTVWGAFRCAKLAGKRVFGSVLVFWLGIEVFALPISLASGYSLAMILNFLVTGLLSLFGLWLAMHHSIRKADGVVKNEALFST